MTIQYTACQRPRRLASSIRMAAADIQGTLTFDPIDGATRMRWSWEVKLRGPVQAGDPLVAYPWPPWRAGHLDRAQAVPGGTGNAGQRGARARPGPSSAHAMRSTR